MSHSDVLSIERDGHVATLWLDRAEARNAMGPEFWAQLPVAMAELSDDRTVRAVVVAARGPHFSVGLDLKAMAGMLTAGTDDTAFVEDTDGAPAEGNGSAGARQPSMASRAVAARQGILRMQSSVTSVAQCPKPVIAAVHGYCIGGGVDVVSACDIRVASADAVFSVRETAGGHRRRPREPPAAARASSARDTSPSSPSPARTSRRRGPRRSAW